MATLSANSRRNSAVSSTSSSPRPSIANGNTPIESSRPQMQSLNEEENVVDAIIPLPPIPKLSKLKAKHSNEIDHNNVEINTHDHNHNNNTETDTTELIALSIAHENKKEKSCTERNDSGFSDCSTISNSHYTNNNVHSISNIAITNSNPLFDKSKSIFEEKANAEQRELNGVKEFGGKVSVNMLKLKLEKMAEAQHENKPSSNTNIKPIKKLSTPYGNTSIEPDVQTPIDVTNDSVDSKQRECHSFDLNESKSASHIDMKIDVNKTVFDKPIKHALMRSASLHHKRIVEKEPIMRSDFTNTVKMRKKSLESNALRDKQIHSPRVILEPSGKVSKLLQRFNSRNNSITSTSSETQIDCIANESNIIESPDIDENDALDKLKFDDLSLTTCNKQQDNEIIEILSTPLAAQSILSPHSGDSRKSQVKVIKPIVSNSSSSRHTVTTKHEFINTKSSVCSMDLKQRSYSPTKFTNNHMAVNNRSLKQTKHVNAIKKSQKSITVEAMQQHQQQSANSIQKATTKATQSNKTTAYASFNRTSPIRLSGRVKEVTVSKIIILFMSMNN